MLKTFGIYCLRCVEIDRTNLGKPQIHSLPTQDGGFQLTFVCFACGNRDQLVIDTLKFPTPEKYDKLLERQRILHELENKNT